MPVQTPPKKEDEGFGLPLTTQKQLLIDIKANGGLEKLTDLETLCDNRKQIYGSPGTATRRQVQNKVQVLKTHENTYQRLQLKLFGGIVDPFTPLKPKQGLKSPTFVPTDLLTKFEGLQVNEMSRFFGKASYDEIHQVKPQAWKNKGVLVWKTKDVSVGKNPTISTDVYSILMESIDPRFFEIKNFEPFKATQISQREVVVEKPCASFDFLFGKVVEVLDDAAPQVQEELEEDEQNEIETVVKNESHVVSRNHMEQKAYMVQRNALTTTEDGEEPDYDIYREKTCYQFPENVNFQLIHPESKNGFIDYSFTVGDDPHSCGVKFRIAVEPTGKQVVKKLKKNKNRAQEKFGRFLLKHAKNLATTNTDEVEEPKSNNNSMEGVTETESKDIKTEDSKEVKVEDNKAVKAEGFTPGMDVDNNKKRSSHSLRPANKEELKKQEREALLFRNKVYKQRQRWAQIDAERKATAKAQTWGETTANVTQLPVQQDDDILMEGRHDVWSVPTVKVRTVDGNESSGSTSL